MDTISVADLEISDLEDLLRDWVRQQPGSITVEEAAEFLGMPQDCDGTYFCTPLIGRALVSLGCEKEVLIHYWPPAVKPAQTPQPQEQS